MNQTLRFNSFYGRLIFATIFSGGMALSIFYSGIRPYDGGRFTPEVKGEEKNIFAQGARVNMGFNIYVFLCFAFFLYVYNSLLEAKGRTQSLITFSLILIALAIALYVSFELFPKYEGDWSRILISETYNISYKTSLFMYTALLMGSSSFLVLGFLLLVIEWVFFRD